MKIRPSAPGSFGRWVAFEFLAKFGWTADCEVYNSRTEPSSS